METKVKEIPVLLLTGYLGSGKTTLVNRILKNERGIKFAVIVNDIESITYFHITIRINGTLNRYFVFEIHPTILLQLLTNSYPNSYQ